MKIHSFLLLILINISLSSFSQDQYLIQDKNDKGNTLFWSFDKPAGLSDSIVYKSTVNDKWEKLLWENKILDTSKDDDSSFNTSPLANTMPCGVSHGQFPMPIHKPDSTTQYSLLIKKLK